MIKRFFITGFLCLVLLLGVAVTGGAFYRFVLPRFEQPVEPPKPKPKKSRIQLYDINPKKKTYVPQIPPLPGTTVVRLAHQASNAHQALALANMGKVTDPGSIFARHGITMRFRPMDRVSERIEALRAMAAAFHRGDPTSDIGAHFFTVGGDVSHWVLGQVDQTLKTVNPDFEAEVVGFSGLSTGEDQFLGPPDWKERPKSVLGGMVAAVPYSSAWNVIIFWCAENEIPFNPDQEYYNPRALNLVETDGPDDAAELYIEEKTVERIFISNGRDYRRRSVKKGEKREVAVNGVATRIPFVRQIVSERGGLVTVASTKKYPNQTPQLIVGLKQWNQQNEEIVTGLLASMFEASQRIEKSHRDIKAGSLEPKSDEDDRWRAAQDIHELAPMVSPDDWYAYYGGSKLKGKGDLEVEIGGASVGSLQQNLLFFGLGQAGPDRGKVVYNRFESLARQYDPDYPKSSPKWESAYNQRHMKRVLEQYPELAQTDPALPAFTLGEEQQEPQEFIYDIAFGTNQRVLTPEDKAILSEAVEQITTTDTVRVEIHGYSDSSGSADRNLELSLRRAEAVYDWLQQTLGASLPEQVNIIPHGGHDLLIEDRVNGVHDEELMAQNRRVLVRVFR